MAARAHDSAAVTVKGKSAVLNFPELAGLLPRPASSSPRDVQVAAALAAAMNVPVTKPNDALVADSPTATTITTTTTSTSDVATPKDGTDEEIDLAVCLQLDEDGSIEPPNEMRFFDHMGSWDLPWDAAAGGNGEGQYWFSDLTDQPSTMKPLLPVFSCRYSEVFLWD